MMGYRSMQGSKMPRRRHHQIDHPRLRSRPPGNRRASAQSRNTLSALRPAESSERLQKVLASAGIASRRESEQLIREGRVEVDRQVITELGTRVDPQRQEIRVDGEALPRPKLVYFAVNKPAGVVSTSRDPAGRPRVIDLLPPDTPRVFAVGRLDLASEGLILVTNDGELANRLTHPRHGVEKIYQVQVAGDVEREVIGQLQRGIRLAEGFAHAKHVRVKSRRKRSTILEMVLDEGRNREIRRLLARVGHKVQGLKRVAVGPLRLGDLPPGAVRPLTTKEIEALKRAAAGVPVAGPQPSSPARVPRSIRQRTKQKHHGDRAVSRGAGKSRSVIGE
jgi:23S rRNA pseudouridine2605 synthase